LIGSDSDEYHLFQEPYEWRFPSRCGSHPFSFDAFTISVNNEHIVLLSQKPVNSLVDKADDILRTVTDYKFILVLLFLKNICDTWKEEFEEKEPMKYLDEKQAEKKAENEVYHTFNLKREPL